MNRAPSEVVLAATTDDVATWIEVVSWVGIAVALLSAVAILADIFLRGHRQQMRVMDAVFPLNASHWGLPMLWFYFRYGRQGSQKVLEERKRRAQARGEDPDRVTPAAGPWWTQVAKSDNHCGAGCWLGDVFGAWIVFLTGWTIAGSHLWTEYIVEFTLAFSFGILFQYFAIAPMRQGSRRAALRDALKADTLSIVAFQVGLFGWMAVYHLLFWEPPIAIDTAAFWFQMMIGMAFGFLTSYPVNAWLIRRGIKEAM